MIPGSSLRSLFGSLFLAVPESVSALLRSIPERFQGLTALIACAVIGALGMNWYHGQVKPSDLDRLEGKMDRALDRQEVLIEDVFYLRRTVCRQQGTPAVKCELRLRRERNRYNFQDRRFQPTPPYHDRPETANSTGRPP